MIKDEDKKDEELISPEEEVSASADTDTEEATGEGNGYMPHNDDEVGEDKIHHLGGMYQNWFLD